jgi:UDP-N-acetylglucosamine--N-acetylmuramyl-(pentapeptide) pyrophosphoryl-undecaprenol N-acetylglucosamine transferase
LGARKINKVVRALLPKLLDDFFVIHICGEGNIDDRIANKGYQQFEYLHDEFSDVLACADLIVSRAGANTVYEVLSLHKPHIFIPLSRDVSRGDQIDNANHFAKKKMSSVVFEEALTPEKLLEKIHRVFQHEDKIKSNLSAFERVDSVMLIYDLLSGYIRKNKR